MKRLPLLAIAAALTLGIGSSDSIAERPGSPPTPKQETPAPPDPPAPPNLAELLEAKRLEFLKLPQVNVDVLMVSLPEEKALPLLTALRNPATVEGAQAKLLEMVLAKEAKLEGWPQITTHSTERAVSESIVEHRYPVEFEPPIPKQATPHGGIPPADEALSFVRSQAIPIPTTFETRNVGTTIEVEPIVNETEKSVFVQIAPQLVRFEGYVDFPAGTTRDGKPVTIPQPTFTTGKVSTNQTLRDGERRLIYVGKSSQDQKRLDLFILGVRILPAAQNK